MSKERRAVDYVQRLCARSVDDLEGRPDLLRCSCAHETQLDRQRRRCCLEVLDCLRMVRSGRIPQDDDPAKAWYRLLEQLQPFGAEFRQHDRQPGDVSPRSRKTCDDAGSDRIGDDRHDDGDGGRGALSRLGCLCGVRDDHIDFALNEVGGQLREPGVVAVGRSPLD